MPITLEQAKQLKYGDYLYANCLFNADEKTPRKYKINGKPKTWKRDPDRIKVPLKWGLYEYGELTNGTYEGNQFTYFLNEMELTEEAAIKQSTKE